LIIHFNLRVHIIHGHQEFFSWCFRNHRHFMVKDPMLVPGSDRWFASLHFFNAALPSFIIWGVEYKVFHWLCVFTLSWPSVKKEAIKTSWKRRKLDENKGGKRERFITRKAWNQSFYSPSNLFLFLISIIYNTQRELSFQTF
jgi:hypothetical protein